MNTIQIALLVYSFIAITNSNGMMTVAQRFTQPKGPRELRLEFDESVENPDLCPVEVVVKQGHQETMRTVYHKGNLKQITFPNNCKETIAPEHFCKKVVTLVHEHNVPYPVIPCQKERYRGTNGCAMKQATHQMFFDPEYVQQREHPFLRMYVGHELGHLKMEEKLKKMQSDEYTNDELMLVMRMYYAKQQEEYRSLQIQKNRNLARYKKAENKQNNSSLAAYAYVNHVIDKMSQVACNEAKEVVPPLHAEELYCDMAALKFFGKTPEEKIDIANEGIALFKREQERASKEPADAFPSSHPSCAKRIKSLEKAKKQLNMRIFILNNFEPSNIIIDDRSY